jgi:hypothetical protein
MPLINAIRNLANFEELGAAISSFAEGSGTFGEVMDSLRDLYSEITNLISGYSLSVIFSFAVVLIVGRFLLGLMFLPLARCLHSRLTANAKTSFTGEYLSSMGKSSKYMLARMLFTVPFDLVMYLILYLTGSLLSGTFFSFLMPMFLFLIVCVFSALKNTLFGLWRPALIMDNNGIFKSLKTSVKVSFSQFGRIFTMMLVTALLGFVLVGLSLLLTFGAGLLIVVPMMLLFYDTLGLVIFYTHRSQRYYVDMQTVVTPPIELIEEITTDNEKK